MNSKPDKQKIAVLLTVAGPEAIDFAAVMCKFDQYCTPRSS